VLREKGTPFNLTMCCLTIHVVESVKAIDEEILYLLWYLGMLYFYWGTCRVSCLLKISFYFL